MIINLDKISETFINKKLSSIQNGNLSLRNYDGELKLFGDKKSSLNANIKNRTWCGFFLRATNSLPKEALGC